MTALSGFERLECEGRYTTAPGVTPLDVVVQFGNASLTILTFDDMPLAHWPLASLHRRSGEMGRVLVSPDAMALETLEIEDATMRSALDAVSNRPPPTSRLRQPRRRTLMLAALLLLLVAGSAAAIVAAQPYAMLAAGIPPEARTALGTMAVREYAGDALCTERSGERALRRFGAILHAETGMRATFFVAAGQAGVTASLGGSVLIGSDALRDAALPLDLAKAVRQALSDVQRINATEVVLRQAGLRAFFDILSGQMTSPPLVAAAMAELAQRHAAAPLTVDAKPTSEIPARLSLQPDQWQAIKAICGP